jgi:hypothetical protein
MAQQYNERTSGTYTANLVDDAGAAVNVGALTKATLTLKDVKTGTILNSRNYQDVKNLNNVTISALGALEWKIQAADNAVVTDKNVVKFPTEEHLATFHFVWPGGELYHLVPIDVKRIEAAPEP